MSAGLNRYGDMMSFSSFLSPFQRLFPSEIYYRFYRSRAGVLFLARNLAFASTPWVFLRGFVLASFLDRSC